MGESLEKRNNVLDRIPTRYGGISDPDLLEEMWQPAILRDSEAQARQMNERKETLDAFRRYVELKEEAKETQVGDWYAKLSDRSRENFPQYQTIGAQFVSDALKHGDGFVSRYAKGLQPEELYILGVLRNEHTAAKEAGRDFVVQLDKPHLQRILNNLIQRLAMAYLKNIENPTPPTSIPPSQEVKRKEKQKSSLNVKDMDSIDKFKNNTELESKSEYLESVNGAIEVLKKHKGIATLENEAVPTVIVSDLHARRDFLANVLKHQVNGESVHEKLKRGEINIVCVGDGMHSEDGKYWLPEYIKYDINGFLAETTDDNMANMIKRYKRAIEEATGKPYEQLSYGEIKRIEKDSRVSEVFDKIVPVLQVELFKREMVRSLGLMKMVMDLKRAFPESFHYTRGNHDDMAEKIKKYRKFADESQDVREWITRNYGNDFLQKYAEFEEALPVMVRSKNGEVVVTHTVPDKPLSKDDIENRSRETNLSLTWTDNTKGGSSQEAVDKTLENINAEDGTWFIGHRDVPDEMGLAREQFGKVVQINNKKKQVIAIKRPGQSFVKDRDTFDVAA